MTIVDGVSLALLALASVFFLAGTVGLLRFPDTYLRLHALTKADNLGVGFTVLALALQAESPAGAVKLLLIWGLVMAAGASAAYLVARHASRRDGGDGQE
ncbi:MAG: cation:proton antiporter [Gammaproteobacteria bacterium]